MTDKPTLRVFYDAACPGCRRDRARYEHWAGEAAASVEWVDVNGSEASLREKGIEPEDALLSLHVEDARGRILEGLDAYIQLMQRVPRLRPLAWLIGLPGLKPLLESLYRRWVRRRLAREGRLP